MPMLACVTTADGQGGIAYVASLVAAVLGRPNTIELAPTHLGRVTLRERLRFAFRYMVRLITDRPSIVFFDHLRLAAVHHLIPRPLRIPYAVFLHDVEAWGDIPQKRKVVMKGATLRICLTDYTRRRILARHPDAGPITVCAPGLHDLVATQKTSGDYLNIIGRNCVVIVARMDETESHKGHDQLLEAWPAILRKVPEAKLLIIGTGSGEARLRRKSQSIGLSSVHFLGFIPTEDMQALLPQCGVFAMPSQREGFGLVYLDAMRAGLPCVAGNMDASSETVLDGETGLIVDPLSVEEIASAICFLLEHPDRGRAMGREGSRRFAASYTFSAFERRFGALCDTP